MRRIALVLGGAAVALAVLAAPALATTTNADKPDLLPALPGAPYLHQVAPVYVDTFTQSGHTLYRFDTQIVNNGGVLDLYRATNGHAMQAIFPGGIPTGLVGSGYVDPNNPPTDPNATYVDLTAAHGASFVYSAATGHQHWHFQSAAKYELLLPGGGSRLSAKVGFCMSDANPNYYPYGMTNGGAQTYCAPLNPSATFVRMGISPNTYDLYNSQVADQWVDVTGLTPGTYSVRATINPSNFIEESDTTNNTLTVTRTIPGTIAAAGSASTGVGQQKAIPVSGTIVGPDVPARSSAGCAPISGSYTCYTTASASGPLTFAVSTQPGHGTVSIGSVNGLTATATYTPTGGYSGPDSFAYTVTDVRGLTSQPATVGITVGSGGGGSAPVNTSPPTISGSATIGSTLTASPGTWTGSPAPTFAYQWQRCNSGGSACAPIGSATGTTYVVAGADQGSTLRVSVTGTNATSSATAQSAATGVVPPAASVTVNSSIADGQTLTGNVTWTSTVTGLPSGVTVTRVQFYIDNVLKWTENLSPYFYNGDNSVLNTTTLTNGSHVFMAKATLSNAATPSSSATATVSNGAGTSPPSNTTLPTISGTNQQGQTLTASPGTWTGSPAPTFAYQWRRCNSAGASCVTIGGATGTTYLLVAGDVGATLRVAVTATNSVSSATATSNQTAVVTTGPTAPVNTSPPSISGTVQQGQTLTGSAGSWTGSPAPTFTYQWQRCDSGGGSCAPIGGATGTTYLLVVGDVGSTIRLAVTGTNASGSPTATSAATAVVAAPPPPGSFPNTPILDPFARADGVAGANWAALFSGEGVFTISAQKAVAPQSTYAAGYWTGGAFGPKVEVYSAFNTATSLSLFARISNPGTAQLSGYTVEFHSNLSAIWIYRITNNVYNGPIGGAIPYTFGSGSRVGMSVVGSTISAYVDTGSGWQLVATRTDSTYAQAGFIGVELYGGTNRSFDDFGGGTAP